MSGCRFVPQSERRWVCCGCGRTALRTSGVPPRRNCVIGERAPPRPLRCIYQGTSAEPVVCRGCSGIVQLKTHVCGNDAVEQGRASWANRPLPSDVASCRTCGKYEAIG